MNSNVTTIGFDIPTVDLGLAFVQAIADGTPLSSRGASVDQSSPEEPTCTVCGKHQCELAN